MLPIILTALRGSLSCVKTMEILGYSHQRGVSWPDDNIDPDSMMCWIIENLRALPTWGCLGCQRALGLTAT